MANGKKVKECYAFEKRSALHNGQLMFVMVTSNSYGWGKKPLTVLVHSWICKVVKPNSMRIGCGEDGLPIEETIPLKHEDVLVVHD